MNQGITSARHANPLFHPLAILLAALALSIGWGIRGNYGHEMGAMFPGALTAIAVCLLSGREDWRERVAYFACFGALGWAFGGSISYMQVIAYSQSGHAVTQFYGFWSLFFIGFLWAALGGAGTALPAVVDRKFLSEMFQPLTLLLALWCLLYFVEGPLSQIVQVQFGMRYGPPGAAHRHETLLYWLDSDWLSVFVILIGILVFDLVDRRFTNSLWLPLFAGAGGLLGHLAERGIVRAGFADSLRDVLVHVQGGQFASDDSALVTNWPMLFSKVSDYLGAIVGVTVGTGIYFALFGKFRRGSSLFLHMALGWFAGFLLFPVLLDVRMTPPRGDNWAGIMGTYAGFLIYSCRHKCWPLVIASVVTGTIGGIGFSGIACLQALLQSFGNANFGPGVAQVWTEWQASGASSFPEILRNVKPSPAWQFWHTANWHSFLEQSYGFVNGIGVIVGMGLLVRRVGTLDNQAKRSYWTEIVAVTLALPVVVYVNMVKNLVDWTRENPAHVVGAVPKLMRMPLIGFPLSATAWFNIIFGIAAIAFVLLLSVHTRRRLALLEQSWLGRGQLFFIVLLWTFVIGNFGKALAGLTEQRLLTEGVVTLNAVFATMMILLLPTSYAELPESSSNSGFNRLLVGSIVAALACAAVIPPLETVCVRAVYGDAPVHRAGKNVPETRFGPHARWKTTPLIKGLEHR